MARSSPERTRGWGTPAGSAPTRRQAAEIAAGAQLGPDRRALEIGCGTGQFTELFAKCEGQLVAVDISPDLLARARARGLQAETVQFLEKRFEDCNVDGPFDAVIGSSVLHHLDLNEALLKIYDLLNPGGWVSFAEPNTLSAQVFAERRLPFLRRWFWYVSPDETAFMPRNLQEHLLRAGFVDIEILPFDWLHPATPAPLMAAVERCGTRLENVPLVREFAGSLILSYRRPE